MKRLVSVGLTVGSCFLTSSCSLTPAGVKVEEVVSARPGIFGFPPMQGRWRKFTFTLPSDELKAVAKLESTIFLDFDDCGGKALLLPRDSTDNQLREAGSQIWLGDRHIFQTEELDYASLAKTITLTGYIDDSLFSRTPQICASFGGGSMIGYGVPKVSLRLK